MFYNAYYFSVILLYFLLLFYVWYYACLYLYATHKQNCNFSAGINKVLLFLSPIRFHPSCPNEGTYTYLLPSSSAWGVGVQLHIRLHTVCPSPARLPFSLRLLLFHIWGGGSGDILKAKPALASEQCMP